MKGATLQVIGIERGNGTTLTRIHNITAVNTNQVSFLLSNSHTQVLFYPIDNLYIHSVIFTFVSLALYKNKCG